MKNLFNDIKHINNLPKRIALFRFHKECQIEDMLKKIIFFKLLNPEVRRFGLYGGDLDISYNIHEKFDGLLEDIFIWNEIDDEIKWRSSDLAYQLWFRERGQYIDFDFLHPIEWDLVFMKSIDELFFNLPDNCLSCTGYTILKNIEHRWYWTRDNNTRLEWLKFLHSIITHFHYSDIPQVILGPCIILPKRFLIKLLSIKISRLCNDELRIPIYAQLFRFSMIDNGLYNWRIPTPQFFNCDKIPIKIETIEDEMKKIDGRRIFHPFMDQFNLDKFIQIYATSK